MTIVWRDQLSVGHDGIDEDHKQLVNLVNGFEWATAGQIQMDILERILDDLEDFSQEHFEREERAQISVRFPFYESHKQAHIEQIDQLREVRQRLASLNPDDREALRPAIAGIVAFLRGWLIDHIVEADMQMKGYLSRDGD